MMVSEWMILDILGGGLTGGAGAASILFFGDEVTLLFKHTGTANPLFVYLLTFRVALLTGSPAAPITLFNTITEAPLLVTLGASVFFGALICTDNITHSSGGT